MAIVATNLITDPRGTTVTNPPFATDAGGGALSAITDFPDVINTAIRHTRTATGAFRLMNILIGASGYSVSTSYRVRFLVRSSVAQTIVVQSRPTATSATNAVTFGSFPLSIGLNEIDVTGTTSAAGTPSVNSGFVINGNTGPAISSTTDVTAILIQRTSDSYTGGYFDGYTSRTGSVAFEWSGTPNNSTSIAFDSPQAPTRKMWFGQEGHFQWVPQPGAGMEVGHQSTYESISYQNGRYGSHATKQNHKTYDMNFPIQEARGDDGLDVFQRYANGYWRDPDIFPLFFADPMNFDKNLFPSNWATPGMYDAGWASPVWDSPYGSVNLAQNPSVTGTGAGWTRFSATNNTASIVASAGSTRGWAYRTTATGGTATNLGAIFGDYGNTVYATGPYVPIQPGGTYSFRVFVEASISRTITMTVGFISAATNSTSSTSATAGTVSNSGYVERLNITCPTDQPYDRVEVSFTSSATTAVNEWIQFSDFTVSPADKLEPTFFDGSSSPDAEWRGTPNASVSILSRPRRVGTVTPESSSLSLGIPNRSLTMPITQRIVNGTARTNSTSVEETQYPYALIPVPPGYRLWVSCAWSRSASLVDLAVDYYQNDNYTGVPNQSTTIPPSGVTQAFTNPRVTARDGDYAKIYFKRTGAGAVDVTLRYMVAQLWPEGVTPPNWTTFPEGMGHRGLKFTETPTTESYVLIDPYRQVPVHYKGASMQLIEAQENG